MLLHCSTHDLLSLTSVQEVVIRGLDFELFASLSQVEVIIYGMTHETKNNENYIVEKPK